MSTRFKKIFLSLSIALPFLAYCFYYYGQMIRNAPFKYSELESIEFSAGKGARLISEYDTKTAVYTYRDNKDSMAKVKVKLFDRDRFYLHKQAADLGLWNMPDSMGNKQDDAAYYTVRFNYQRKSKSIFISQNFSGKTKLKDAAIQLARTVEKTINDAEDTQHQPVK